jgi:hypothetical protein
VGQAAAVEVVVVVPETVVVVNWQGCQFTARFVVVPPVTVALRVVDCPTIILVPIEDVTVTVTVLVEPPPPQPAASQAAIIAAVMYVKIIRNLIQLPPK